MPYELKATKECSALMQKIHSINSGQLGDYILVSY